MNITSILITLLWATACGRGADALAHLGVCDRYPTAGSSSYKLPFAPATSHLVGQGNCSPASHYGAHRYAYDLSMPINTPVYAARAGTVVAVKENESDGNGCPNANYIYVQHSDGTVAAYLHLTLNGALVNLNDVVIQGQDIGRSGNTGCSTAPHLHFAVWRDSTSTDTMAVTFSNAGSNPRGLQTGQSYTAQ